MTLNLKPLDDAIAYIEAHPEEWNQITYREFDPDSPTGEVGCLAYHICKQVGAVFDPDETEWWVRDPKWTDDGWEMIPDYAQRVLGVSSTTSGELFLSTNSIERLKLLRDRLHRVGDFPTVRINGSTFAL